MDVGVHELKQDLSEYLDRAADGETIRVTERGIPKVCIGPLMDRLIGAWPTGGCVLPCVSGLGPVADFGAVVSRMTSLPRIASAQRLHIRNLTFITFDLRQAQAARSLGFVVLGC